MIQRLSLLNHFENSDNKDMENHFSRTTRRYFIFFFNAIVLFFLSTACVSVSVPFGPARKAEKAKVAKPAGPFNSISSASADEAWISEETGNTISYLSECKETDQKIEDIAKDTARAVENARIIQSSKGSIDSRPSADLIVTGRVETDKVKIAISVFKADKCTFSLTYGGLEEKFNQELSVFESFKKGFKVP